MNQLIHDVVLHELPRGRHSAEYLGEVLVASSSDPAFDACRALFARGIRGKLRTRQAGAEHHSLQLDIGWGAQMCTRETPTAGPMFAKWEDPARISARCIRGSEKTAISGSPLLRCPNGIPAVLESVSISAATL